jgi:hypothetical protein
MAGEVCVSEPRSASTLWTGAGKWSIFGGACLALLGHTLAVVATVAAARSVGGGQGSDVDLDTGGRSAVAFAMLMTFFLAQVVLPVGLLVISAFAGRSMRVGLFAGWGGGSALILGSVVTWFISAS